MQGDWYSCNSQAIMWRHDTIPPGVQLRASPTRDGHLYHHRLVGLVVKASASRAEDPGFESRLRRDFSQVES